MNVYKNTSQAPIDLIIIDNDKNIYIGVEKYKRGPLIVSYKRNFYNERVISVAREYSKMKHEDAMTHLFHTIFNSSSAKFSKMPGV